LPNDKARRVEEFNVFCFFEIKPGGEIPHHLISNVDGISHQKSSVHYRRGITGLDVSMPAIEARPKITR
jgi:hypothetical protein